MTTGATPTARAYWDLKAEQVMDRVFAPTQPAGRPPTHQRGDAGCSSDAPAAEASAEQNDDSIEVEVREAPPRPMQGPPQRATTAPWGRLPRSWPAAGLICVTCGLTASLWIGWHQASQELRQERTVRLLEGLRNVGSGGAGSAAALASGAATAADSQASGGGGGGGGESLPPPPPAEPWIEDLHQLSGSGTGAVAPLQVPVSGTLQAAAPPASTAFSRPITAPPPLPPGLDGGMPELVGVVQIPGRAGSAIFQLGSSSTNAGSGEAIGSSGWRLVSTNGDSAVIERGGQRRRVSISSGF